MLRCAARLSRRRFASAASGGSPWHVAIVGSGPAGFYTADFLLKGSPDVRVDIYERLPVPFGLVRYGVAPDHQSVKNVTERFAQIASDPRCSLLANVLVGPCDDAAGVAASVPLQTLREQYHAIVLAGGADRDRTLGLPGEDLDGVHSARQFVEWYNGHPSAVGRSFGLQSCETAVVIGHGNVALDCARMLTSTPEQLLGDTDVAAHAAAELSNSGVRQVALLGRRGCASTHSIPQARLLGCLQALCMHSGRPRPALTPSENARLNSRRRQRAARRVHDQGASRALKARGRNDAAQRSERRLRGDRPRRR